MKTIELGEMHTFNSLFLLLLLRGGRVLAGDAATACATVATVVAAVVTAAATDLAAPVKASPII